MALSLYGNGQCEAARTQLAESLARYEGQSPFDMKLSAHLAQVQIELALGAPFEEVEARLRPLLETASKKKMSWHIGWALMLRAEGLLTVNRGMEGEEGLRETLQIARRNADRTRSWQAHHLLGRVYEQALAYERALTCYRAAALTIQEIAMDLREDRYRRAFLAQEKARDAVERYTRLRGEVGRQARRDLATLNRNEMVSRKMIASLSAVAQQLSSTLDLEQLLANLLDLAIENVRAERGMVFLLDKSTGDMCPELARGMERDTLEEVTSFSRSVIRQVARGQTILKVDVGSDPTLTAFDSVVLHEIKSILCVPMKSRGRVVGVLYLDTRKAAQMFTDKERAFVESFASQAAIAIENARLFGQMTRENARLRREARSRGRCANLIGESPAMRRLADLIESVLPSESSVLITGESGTGKELVARALHYEGPRQGGKFVAIDCGALPENLLEAELFGYVHGAFTGAERDRVGLIEEANGGTLFLDEVNNMEVPLQARLLRVLQEREVRRLGENTPRRTNVRVIAASNADLGALLAQGRFRQDLYYRLNVVTIEVPPLRERREDIPLLVGHFLRLHAGEGEAGRLLGPGVIDRLTRHSWPGNVRELQNVVERLALLSPGKVITLADLPDSLRLAGPPENSHGPAAPFRPTAEGVMPPPPTKTGEQMMIEDALRRCDGDKTRAARFIGWNRQKLYRRIKAYGIAADFGKAA